MLSKRLRRTDPLMSYFIKSVFVTLIMTLFLSSTANAQWVYLGRKALGKVQQFTGSLKSDQQPGFDLATVIIEAQANKVYRTALSLLKDNKELKITKQDDKSRTVEFSKGNLSAGLQANLLDDNLCQLVVISNGSSEKPDPTSIVLNSVFRICREMKVSCQLAEQ